MSEISALEKLLVPDLHLSEFSQLLLHVVLQLSWLQNSLADWTYWGVIETLYTAWKKRKTYQDYLSSWFGSFDIIETFTIEI